MYAQITEFWHWIRIQPIPDNVSNDETVKQWQDIVKNGTELYNSGDKPLLKELMIAGLNFLEA